MQKHNIQADHGDTFTACPNPFKKESRSILLTTGADSSFSVQNIYDIAGNVWEWTLEKASDVGLPCASRGGDFGINGSDYPAANRGSFATTHAISTVGFRLSLW